MKVSKSHRIYVGNIPLGVTDTDLQQEFSAYGNVQHVDFKRKENLVDPGNPILFAFITLDISDHGLKKCIAEFSSEQYRGRYLSISLAKESFLDRLKREREENARNQPQRKVEQKIVEPIVDGSKIAALPKIKAKTEVVESSSSESSSTESSEDSEDETTKSKPAVKSKPDYEDISCSFISKKNASASLQNGKIKILSIDAKPIHVITKIREVKHLEGNAQQSDQRRKESLHKMKNHYNQQKLAIQQALSSVDTGKRNKIIFDSTDVVKESPDSNKNAKLSLFDGNEEELGDYNADFQVKTQFQGNEGEKLMRLQSKFKLDPRFAMNSQFLEEEDENPDEQQPVENDERKWQLGIIEQVVGKKFNTTQGPNRINIKNAMTRFDPSKEEHKRFYKTTGDDINEDDVKNNKKRATTDADDVDVSKEQFYNISKDLTKSLRRRGDGFSLLSMFGRADNQAEGMQQQSNQYNEKPLLKGKSDSEALNNPFKFDSSDSEDDAEQNVTMKSENDDTKIQFKNAYGGKLNKTGIWNENFFIFNADQRFQDGAAFFEAHGMANGNGEQSDYDEVKRTLSNIIRRKIIKKRKNVDGFKTRASKFKKRK